MSPCTLIKLAPEIRNMIFELKVSWNGKTPEIIKALRPAPILYHEALDMLCRNFTFRLSYDNNWMVEKWSPYMSINAIRSIRNLQVEIDEVTHGGGSAINPPPFHEHSFRHAANLTKLHLTHTGCEHESIDFYWLSDQRGDFPLPDLVERYILGFPNLEIVKFGNANSCIWRKIREPLLTHAKLSIEKLGIEKVHIENSNIQLYLLAPELRRYKSGPYRGVIRYSNRTAIREDSRSGVHSACYMEVYNKSSSDSCSRSDGSDEFIWGEEGFIYFSDEESDQEKSDESGYSEKLAVNDGRLNRRKPYEDISDQECPKDDVTAEKRSRRESSPMDGPYDYIDEEAWDGEEHIDEQWWSWAESNTIYGVYEDTETLYGYIDGEARDGEELNFADGPYDYIDEEIDRHRDV